MRVGSALQGEGLPDHRSDPSLAAAAITSSAHRRLRGPKSKSCSIPITSIPRRSASAGSISVLSPLETPFNREAATFGGHLECGSADVSLTPSNTTSGPVPPVSSSTCFVQSVPRGRESPLSGQTSKANIRSGEAVSLRADPRRSYIFRVTSTPTRGFHVWCHQERPHRRAADGLRAHVHRRSG